MTKLKFTFAALALLLLMGTFALADTVIYDNGGPNQQNGNEMTQWVQTEDFTLTSTQTVTDIHFWDVDQGTYAGTISWWIVGDAAGDPDWGNMLGAGQLDVGRAATGICLSFGCEFENSWNIDPLVLGPGTYHLALHNGELANNQRAEFYWETTNPNATPTGRKCDLTNGACFNSWSDNFQEHAFNLTGGQRDS